MTRTEGGRLTVLGFLCLLLAACGGDAKPPRALSGTRTPGSGGDQPGDAGNGGSGGSAVGALTQVIGSGPWQIGQSAPGIAVDATGRVYLTDGVSVYTVDGSTVDVYLNEADRSAIEPGRFAGFLDLDIGPDGLLYVLTSDGIIRSSAAHQGELLRDLSDIIYPAFLGVISDSLIGVINHYDGYYGIEPSGNTMIYGSDRVLGGTDCACEDLAVARSGVFLYQPGCNGSPLVKGTSDGTAVGVLFESEYNQSSPLHASNFLCSTRDPLGGFFVVVEDNADGESRIYHLDENVTSTAGYGWVPTAPSMALARAQSDSLTFRYCSVAAGDGVLYIQTFQQLWRVDLP
jgi:hypothetical protein